MAALHLGRQHLVPGADRRRAILTQASEINCGDGVFSLASTWLVKLLVIRVVCVVVAAVGSLPLVFQEAADRTRGHIGAGFALGLLISVALLFSGFAGMLWLRDLITPPTNGFDAPVSVPVECEP